MPDPALSPAQTAKELRAVADQLERVQGAVPLARPRLEKIRRELRAMALVLESKENAF